MKKILAVLILALTVFSCKKKPVTDQAAVDRQIITNYISSHSLNAQSTPDGLYYVITTQGTGTKPTANSTVTVLYNGYYTDGSVFDRSSSTGLSCALSSVIKGWQEGIPLFNVGGKGKLLVPSALGYGPNGSGSIGPNTVLIFDIQLTASN
jgi:FKBP-type peptidyl-prolyl cis-trans isomerase FkpA